MCLVLTSLSFSFNLFYTWYYTFTIWLSIGMTLLWGVQDGCVQCLVACICGFQFNSNTTPFSVFKSVQSLAQFVLFVIEATFKSQKPYIYFFAASMLYSILAYLLLLLTFDWRVQEDPHKSKSEVENTEEVSREEMNLIR